MKVTLDACNAFMFLQAETLVRLSLLNLQLLTTKTQMT